MGKYPSFIRYFFVFCIIALFFTSRAVLADEKQPGTAGLSREEALRLGERIYREGILPSGKPVEAVVKRDITVEGSMFSCQSCHMRAGLGSLEGGIYSPPTNGLNLFKPLKFVYKGFVQDQVPPRRPAYIDASLAEVLRYGDDPSGRILNDVMPRYDLNDDDMAILISYLKTLSSQFSPGVTDTTISFATVISEDVSARDRDDMLAPLEKYVDSKNKLADYFETFAGWKSRRMAEGMFVNSKEFVNKRLSLSRWVLKGPPETWRGQLEEYYLKEPVFALIGGITTGEWGPVHKFCEENRIPSIFPYTDFPVISDRDWYTLYLSKGFYQEGEGAARFLNSMRQLAEHHKIIQIVRNSREGRSLADGFRKTWVDLGHEEPMTLMLKEGEKFNSSLLSSLVEKKIPSIVLIWDGDGAIPIMDAITATGEGPRMIFLSYGYVGKSVMSIKETARDFTFITHPYRISGEPVKNNPAFMIKVMPKDATKISNQTFSIIEILNMAFMRMKGNYYRDNFLDVIDCIMDLEVPYYERISFGPGQRYAAKGCYIVQLSHGADPKLVKKSDWVIH
jgi:hypothetical protein